MNRKDLQNLVALGEGFTTEFKRARTSGMTEADLGVKSIPRNPLLFGMLHRMEAVENIGSGIRRIYNLCRGYGVEEPKIAVSDNWFTVIFPRPQGEGDKTQIEAKGQVRGQEGQVGGQEGQVALQKWEVAILEMCACQAATGSQLLESAGFTRRTGFFRRGLEKLLKLGFLEMTIPDKPRSSKQRYRLSELGKEILKKQGKEQA